MQIKKNRYDGENGSMAIGFNKGCKNFFALKVAEVDYLENSVKGHMEDIIQNRTKE
jgi:hypothetical protein